MEYTDHTDLLRTPIPVNQNTVHRHSSILEKLLLLMSSLPDLSKAATVNKIMKDNSAILII